MLVKRWIGTLVPTKYLKCQADSKTEGKHQQRGCTQDKTRPPGRWRGWSAWSMCSHSCGTGIKIRTRKCRTGKGECEGAAIVSLDCQTGKECPKKILTPIARTPIGIGKNCGPHLQVNGGLISRSYMGKNRQ